MIHVDVPQQTAAWFKERAGIPTASEFHKLLTPSTLKLSKQADAYMYRLLAEWMTGKVFTEETRVWTTAIEDGIEREQQAADYYELVTERKTSLAGFCMTDDKSCGASPDRISLDPSGEEEQGTDDGILEIKAPLAATHVGWLIEYECTGTVPTEHVLQVQGQLYVCKGRLNWHDFLSFYPGLPPLLIRSEPDRLYQDAIGNALRQFHARMDEAKQLLERLRA